MSFRNYHIGNLPKYLYKWELDDILGCCNMICQLKYFTQELEEINKYRDIKVKTIKIKKLDPINDVNRVLRAGGRIEAL